MVLIRNKWVLTWAFLSMLTATSTLGQQTQAKKSSQSTDRAKAVHESSDDSILNFPKNFLLDQKTLWTAPLRVRSSSADFLAPVGILTGSLLATDRWVPTQLDLSTNTQNRFNTLSNAGLFTFAAIPGGLYVLGHMRDDEKQRHAGLVTGEAMVDALVVDEALKVAFTRERPNTGSGRGKFFQGGSNNSFPSAHAVLAWSSAAVLTQEYPGWGSKLIFYLGATGVSASRVLAEKHFPSDVVVGSALGYLIGRKVAQMHQGDRDVFAQYGNFITERPPRSPANMGSPYVPLDSWVYPAIERLQSLELFRSALQGMRPWTRIECARLVMEASDELDQRGEPGDDLHALRTEFADEIGYMKTGRNLGARVESVYTRFTGISGPPLTDGYHFGQTIYNDYGRPYQEGFNSVTGLSVWGVAGPLAFYVRGEYQHAPTAAGYPDSVRMAVANADDLPVVPAGPIPAVNRGRLLDAYVSYAHGGWQASFGQQSLWWGPGDLGDLMFSTNANPMLMARVSRTTPAKLPFPFRFMGPVRTELFLGQVRGTQFVRLGPNNIDLLGSYTGSVNPQPFVLGTKLNFKPTPNLEFGFSVTDVFAGLGRPLTFGTFRSQFSLSGSTPAPNAGDRRTGFDFSYRIPGLRKYLVLYNGSMAEDEPNPIAYPRRSAMNPGIYIPQLPGLRKLDLRAEAAYTDLPGLLATGYYYINGSYPNGFQNYGNIMGSWVGRQSRGMQFKSTYWFSSQTKLQVGYRKQGANPDFIGGGTIHDGFVRGDVQIRPDVSLKGFVQYERWDFPVLSTVPKSNLTTSIELVFQPRLWRK